MLKSTILSVIRPLSFLPKPCTPVIALEQNCSGLSYWKQYSTMKLEVPSHRFECLHFTAIVVAPALDLTPGGSMLILKRFETF